MLCDRPFGPRTYSAVKEERGPKSPGGRYPRSLLLNSLPISHTSVDRQAFCHTYFAWSFLLICVSSSLNASPTLHHCYFSPSYQILDSSSTFVWHHHTHTLSSLFFFSMNPGASISSVIPRGFRSPTIESSHCHRSPRAQVR